MSVLKTAKRPAVKFDPTNPEHRKWLGEFTVTQSWGNCPVQLVISGYGNTVATMQTMLLQYYTSQEFNK
jgi:hypothetical protein